MPSPTVDYILDDVLMHDHEAGDITDLTSTLDPRYVNITGDTMTGGLTITPATDTLTALVVNDKDANNVLTVDTINNRVGIGTTSPGYKLHVSGDAAIITAANADVLRLGGANSNLVFNLYTPTVKMDTWGTQPLALQSVSGNNVSIGYADPGTARLAINGNVGIGTTSPLGTLDTRGSATAGTWLGLFAQNGITPENSAVLLTAQNKAVSVQGDGAAYFMGRDVTNDIEFIMGTSNLGTAFAGSMTAHDFQLRTDNLTRVTIQKTTGNVGIGTTSPVTKLDLSYNSAIVSIGARFVNTATSGSTSGAGMVGLSDDGAAMASGDRLGYFLLGGSYDNSHTLTNTAGMSGFATEAWSATNKGTRLAFEGTPTGSATRAEWMTIKDGNVGIGTTSPVRKLQVVVNDAVTNPFGSGGYQALSVQNTNTTDNNWVALSFAGQDTGGTYASAAFFAAQITDHTPGSMDADFTIWTNQAGTIGERMRITNNGKVGIGTTAPTNLLSLGGNTTRTFWMERHTTANTAGNTLTITAGGATSGATNKAGGALILQGGLSTGSAESGVTIQGCVAGASGTTDRTQTTMIQVLGNKVGFFTATPVVQQTGIATQKIDYTAGDLDTEAEIITAINTTNTAINALRTALNNLGITTTV